LLFCEKLKTYRTEHGLTQDDVAASLYVSRQTISKWENGVNEPDIHTILRLSDIYSVTLDDLLRGDEIVIQKLARKERSYKKLIWLVAILSGIVLLGLLCISVALSHETILP
jgi:transcriptional regulator with XRE-family HTH domain